MARTTAVVRNKFRTAVAVGVVMFLSVWMITASAKMSNNNDVRHPEDLSDVVRDEAARQTELVATLSGLEQSVEDMTALASAELPALPSEVKTSSEVATGATPVTGPGLKVSLWDAPQTEENLLGYRPDDLVVHQQDLQSVINALWAGGAEAMTLQGQRVTPTTAFRCVGNVLLLHGQVYSPPFVVEAVGDRETLNDALDSSPEVQNYRAYVDVIQLGWALESVDKLEIPAAHNSPKLKHAAVPEGTDLWG
ncbi:DUF881 domain-containing protein [Jonesia quinghaiensis]|uniref:DUF881 domain-containing protein n=1 Tax=Jonesia quinghaiensis TaxID=262806 RepID=UPI00041B1848|nr:DUF881 domain-containing protein [Jonesia quinghaiensis]